MSEGRPYPSVTITRKGERLLASGHCWAYADEIGGAEELGPDVQLVDVRSQKGSYLGTGWLNPRSKIRVRILSTNANDRFDEAFFLRRVRYAWEYRKVVLSGATRACRLIASEADQLPGLTVDRYGDVLVARTLSAGMEGVKPLVFSALAQVLAEDGEPIAGIYERNDSSTRALEGLDQQTGWYEGPGVPLPVAGYPTEVRISENGVLYDVDVAEGQKTGFFLDQKLNRAAAARIAPGKTVLDCFTHIGSFGLNAALAGAAHVHSVDISESAIERARHNARINGLGPDRIDFEVADVFELLDRLEQERRGAYDYVILDPPAFAKTRRAVSSALRGYHDINVKAMRILPRGGYLATASCSHFVTDDLFREMLARSARDAHVSLRQIEARQQSPDHPVLWGVPETSYLKFYLFQVV